jgi:hypothetical protein
MYYLSFDCATKTFAYSLSYVNLSPSAMYDGVKKLIDSDLLENSDLLKNLENSKNSENLENLENLKNSEFSKKFNNFKSQIINLIDGEVIDFFPKIPDNKIDSVERIKKISNYVKEVIFPKIKDIENIEIFIEFQMGSNHKARMISSALIALFSSHVVRLIHPSLKNKVYTCEDGKYKHFIKKYSNLYTANKEHAKYNFAILEKIFSSSISSTNKNDRGHIADSFMQVLGYVLYKL